MSISKKQQRALVKHLVQTLSEEVAHDFVDIAGVTEDLILAVLVIAHHRGYNHRGVAFNLINGALDRVSAKADTIGETVGTA